MCQIFRHNNRNTLEPSNIDIDPERTKDNYSFEMDHGGLSDYAYYKKRVDACYLYGRGTKREKNAITGFGIVTTLPRELRGHPDKEKEFFKGVYDFYCERYGAENVINNAVHYDEAGLPHLHLIIIPVTSIDHDVIRYKTRLTKETKRLDCGRYEFKYTYVTDASGERIPVKNYARLSDYYDEKIDAYAVLNKAELRMLHRDMQDYLEDHNIDGKVITGTTGGINFTVKELKAFTKETGLTLDDVKTLTKDKSLLVDLIEKTNKITDLEATIKKKDEKIKELEEKVRKQEIQLTHDKDHEIASDHTKGWNRSSGWGKEHDKDYMEEHTW